MSKWYIFKGTKHVDIMIEVEDDYSLENAEADVVSEYNLDDIVDSALVPDDAVETYKRHATDIMEL